jgi:predicted YcjX-like family ATPase
VAARFTDAGALSELVAADDRTAAGQREAWSARWRQLCDGLDPLAPADDLAEIAAAWTDYLHACKREGHFIQPGALSAGAVRRRCSFPMAVT